MEEETIIIGRDGIEYVVSAGKMVEKCLHKTRRDESSGYIHKEVCHDCEKVVVNVDNSPRPQQRDTLQEFSDNFRAMHGRDPKGIELSAIL